MRTLLRVKPVLQMSFWGAATSQRRYDLNEVKASVFRRWPVTTPYRGEQTTRWTGGYDFLSLYIFCGENYLSWWVWSDFLVGALDKIFGSAIKKLYHRADIFLILLDRVIKTFGWTIRSFFIYRSVLSLLLLAIWTDFHYLASVAGGSLRPFSKGDFVNLHY